MLEGEQPVEKEWRDRHAWRVDAENPARLSHGLHSASPGPKACSTARAPLGSALVIDLHTHSTCSDGSKTPEEVVEAAVAAGCSAVALTDHDRLDGLPPARRRADALGIRLVDGCEVSCATVTGSLHLLCYFIDETGPLGAQLAELRADRERRNIALGKRLGELGLGVDLADARAEAGGEGIGRPHFAAALVRRGHASSIAEAFDRYLAKGRPAYVPKAQVDPAAIIAAVQASGGVTALAHPLSLECSDDELAARVSALAAMGLGGLECLYGRYDPATRAALVDLATRCGLVATGGSDFHGAFKPDLSVGTGLGDLCVPDEVLVALETRRPGA